VVLNRPYPYIIAVDTHSGADMPIGVGEALSRGYIEGPEVLCAPEIFLNGTFTNWPPMGAGVIDGVTVSCILKAR
jgi:hypothetical protein